MSWIGQTIYFLNPYSIEENIDMVLNTIPAILKFDPCTGAILDGNLKITAFPKFDFIRHLLCYSRSQLLPKTGVKKLFVTISLESKFKFTRLLHNSLVPGSCTLRNYCTAVDFVWPNVSIRSIVVQYSKA